MTDDQFYNGVIKGREDMRLEMIEKAKGVTDSIRIVRGYLIGDDEEKHKDMIDGLWRVSDQMNSITPS